MRLIDADSTKEKLGFEIEPFIGSAADEIRNDTLLKAIAIVDSMPTVDAQPVKRGKWLMHSVEFGDFEGELTRLKNIEIQTAKCSECGKWAEQVNHVIWSMPFCPNCGSYNGGDEK